MSNKTIDMLEAKMKSIQTQMENDLAKKIWNSDPTARCDHCGFMYPHPAALREHLRVGCVKAPQKPQSGGSAPTFLGMPLKVDPSLPPGTFRFQPSQAPSSLPAGLAKYWGVDLATDDGWKSDFYSADPAPSILTLNKDPMAVVQELSSRLAEQERRNSILAQRLNGLAEQMAGSLRAHDAKIAALEKQLANYSFDVTRHRGLPEKPDYTKWTDEQDLLEDDYRGWPVKKERIVF